MKRAETGPTNSVKLFLTKKPRNEETMTTKKPAAVASAWIAGGETHRPAHEARAKKAQPEPDPEPKGGRPPAYDEPTARLNLLLPESLVRETKIRAMDERVTPGQVVAAALRKHLKVKQ